jgi:alpha-2-macroglobulin
VKLRYFLSYIFSSPFLFSSYPLDKLPEGVWEIRYQLRAEAPGRFHALPVIGHAMYAPEIRVNSVETRLIVEDGK